MDITYTDPRSAETLMANTLLVRHLAGSRAYGMASPTSDYDYRGVFCADPVNLLTPFFPIRECVDVTEEDTKYYELSHFMKLVLDCNPNIIETLWVDIDDITYATLAYQHLRNNRHHLLSSKVAFTFSGYALAQLKRIKGHNKWLNNPQPEEPPQPKDFLSVVQYFGSDKRLKIDIGEFLNDHRLIPYGRGVYGVYPISGYALWDHKGNLNDVFQDSVEDYGFPILIVKWNKEEYKLAKEKHEHYWEWKFNRNQVRNELEEQFGYDTKHAAHLVRLLRMGVEILRDHRVFVKRPDSDQLLSIRNGEWTYDQLVNYAEHMDQEIRDVWYRKTTLPKYPDIKFAAKLLMETQNLVWGVK